MKFPKISIITPSYNQDKFLEECVQSVVNQNYPNIEYIVIDGGSTDNSLKIIQKYESKINFWISEPDNGTYDANNKGLIRISGDYWCILNSDDILLPDTLVKLAEIISEKSPDWISAGIHVLNENSEIKSKIIPEIPEKIAGLTFLNRCWIYHPSTFLSRKILESAGFFSNSTIMDYEYWIRLEKKGFFPLIINDYFAGLRFHKECKSFDFQNIRKENSKLLYSVYKNPDFNFCKREKTELRNKIAKERKELLVNELKICLFKKKYTTFVLIMVRLLLVSPAVIYQRFFWGLFRRIFIGIRLEEFHPHYDITEQKKATD